MNYNDYMDQMTLTDIQEIAKNLRLNFLERDINIVFRAGKPGIVVDV